LSAKLKEKEVNLKAGFLISVIALGATSFAYAQSYSITFNVYQSGSFTEGRMDFDDTTEKHLAIDAMDVFSRDWYYCSDYSVTESVFWCGWPNTLLRSGTMWFGVSSTNTGQADWLSSNCSSGWIGSGDPFLDTCEERDF
jgi:hypothetical protein